MPFFQYDIFYQLRTLTVEFSVLYVILYIGLYRLDINCLEMIYRSMED